MRLFDPAAAEYDAARPIYPDGVYDLLDSLVGGLSGKVVADGGAGTGVATRQLLGRGAWVVPFDPGPAMLGHALERTPALPVVVADAARVPLRSSSVDLVCFAQSWHWVDQALGTSEAGRVLCSGGYWAGWWSHPWADSEAWFDEYFSLIEERCAGASRHQRDVDWCSAALAASSAFEEPRRHIVAWDRRVSMEDWLIDLRSHSYVIDLPASERQSLLNEVSAIIRRRFGEEMMMVPYQTRVWVARRR
ncbi:MAG: class I SAM-dependent methyltransferase [Acidimicrobiales bacterium]